MLIELCILGAAIAAPYLKSYGAVKAAFKPKTATHVETEDGLNVPVESFFDSTGQPISDPFFFETEGGEIYALTEAEFALANTSPSLFKFRLEEIIKTESRRCTR